MKRLQNRFDNCKFPEDEMWYWLVTAVTHALPPRGTRSRQLIFSERRAEVWRRLVSQREERMWAKHAMADLCYRLDINIDRAVYDKDIYKGLMKSIDEHTRDWRRKWAPKKRLTAQKKSTQF